MNKPNFGLNGWKEMNPLKRQFLLIKEKHPDALLLFQVDDFYESYGNDAETIAKITNLPLTKSDNVYLCGFPSYALDMMLPKLVRAGNKVAICEKTI